MTSVFTRPPRARAEQVVENGHPHRDAGRDLVQDNGVRRVGDVGGDLQAAVHGTRVKDRDVRVGGGEPTHTVAGEAVGDGVLAGRGEVPAAHPLALDAQHHHGVDRAVGAAALEHLVEVPGRGEPVGLRPVRDAARHEGRWRDDGDVRAEPAEGDDVGAEHPRVGQVADDGDVPAVEVADPVAEGVGVEQGLRGVLVGAVPGVDDAGVDPLGHLLARARGVVPDDQGVDGHGVDRADGVAQRLALARRGALAGDVDGVGGHPLAGDLERAAGPGGVLEEEVDDGPAAQGRDLLDVPLLHVVHRLGGGEDGLDVVAAQVRRGQQVPVHRSPPSMVTESSPSISVRWTRTRSERGRRQVLPDVVGADRELAVAPVDEDGEPHGARAAELGERLQGGADGPAVEQDVVDEHHDTRGGG